MSKSGKAASKSFLNWQCAVLKLTGFALFSVLTGCEQPSTEPVGPRDHLIGWYKVVKGDTIVPVFKRSGAYYSVCRGVEVPFKECPEGLEWALTPSSMVGTKIGWDAASKSPYLAVVDSQASNFTDDRYGVGEKEAIARVDKPSGLLDAKAKRLHVINDFIGWYQPVWFPCVRIEICKTNDRFFSQEHEFNGSKPGAWETRVERRELTPLSDQLGFTGFDRKHRHHLVYNSDLNRFELVNSVEEKTPAVIRMPLARVPSPVSLEGGAAPAPLLRIGIPSWH